MYSNPKYSNEQGGILLSKPDGVDLYVDKGSLWERAIAGEFGEIAPYAPPPEPTPEEILAAERAAMVCTPAQMRLALYRMGLLSQVQAIADGDPEASIVWEYATQIVRTSPLIEALSGDFTGSDIDEIFRSAMAVET